MAYSDHEQAFIDSITRSYFPEPEMDPVQVAAGPSSTMTDAAPAAAGSVPEMKAYDPTIRERMAEFLQAGFEKIGFERYQARKHAQSLMGGQSSNLPLDMGIADFVPFLGTALQTQEAGRNLDHAATLAGQGEYGAAAIEGAAGAIGLIPGAAGTMKYGKQVLNSAPQLKGLPVGASIKDISGKEIPIDPAPKTSTKAFKNWFSDSKVVNDKGQPLVVYHTGSFDETVDPVPSVNGQGFHFGTERASEDRVRGKLLDDFVKQGNVEYDNELGAWYWGSNGVDSYDLDAAGFATKAEARKDLADYAANYADHYQEGADLVKTKAYLSIKNPKRMKDQGGDWSKAIEQAKKEGYDGIVYRNEFEDKGKDSYIVFSATQIKSVNNHGTFGPKNSNVLHGAGAATAGMAATQDKEQK